MQINIISTNNSRGAFRRDILIPKLLSQDLYHTLHVVEVLDNTRGEESLWNAVKKILKVNLEADYVIIMEDDCIFRVETIKDILLSNIEYCQKNNIHALFTGCSKVARPEGTSNSNIITISAAHNSQLVVVFRPLFKVLIDFPVGGNWDLILSSMSQLKGTKVGLTLPFLTGQLKSGDSGINPDKNEEIGERFEIEEQRLTRIFKK